MNELKSALRSRSFRARAAAALAAVGTLVMAGGLAVLGTAGSATATPGTPHKVWICHATSSDSNPYVAIDVDVASKKYEGHLMHRNAPSKTWKDATVWNGVTYAAGSAKRDFIEGLDAGVTEAFCNAEGTPPPPADVCSNIDGVQTEIPAGYHADGLGGCVPDETAPADVCSNIDGVQTEIPAGYHADGSGGCVPDETAPVDVCSNIDGVQTEIPAGYHADGSGGCVPDETAPADVCSNIDGVQTEIPAGYHADGSGGCVPDETAPVDVCSNIDGVQTEIPAGYHADGSGGCVPDETAPADVCSNIDGVQTEIPAGYESDGHGGCAQVLGTESVRPKPTRHHTTAAPTTRPAVVLGTEAVAPTAIDAGLATWPGGPSQGSSTGTRLGQGLVGGGLVLLMTGGLLGLGRRRRGAHEA